MRTIILKTPLHARTLGRFNAPSRGNKRTPARTTFLRIKKETKVKTRTVSRRVRHVRQLTVPVVLGFHQRPSVQFAGFQFNLIRRRRRKKKVCQCAILYGPQPLKNTLSEEEEEEEKSIPNIKKTRLVLSLRSSSLSFASFITREQEQVEEEEQK